MSDNENKNVNNDYDYSRETLYELIERGKDALENMIEVARESEHPRAYEVLSGLNKNVSDVNDKLMDLNKKQKDINKEDMRQVADGTTNNFYLTTSDLQKMMKNDEDEKLINVTPTK